MNISQWPGGHVVLAGCALAAVVLAVVVGGLAFGGRGRQRPGTAAEAADKTEYLTSIAVVEPSKKAAANGKVRKQAVEAVQRPVTLRLTGSLAPTKSRTWGATPRGS